MAKMVIGKMWNLLFLMRLQELSCRARSPKGISEVTGGHISPEDGDPQLIEGG